MNQQETSHGQDQPEDGCVRFRELISASLDGELNAAEQETLAEHLVGCGPCQDHRARLRRLRPLLRAVNPLLAVAPDALEALDARLADEIARPTSPSGRVISYEWGTVRIQLLKAAAVLAFVTGAALFLVQQLQPEPSITVRPTPTPPRPTPTPSASALPTPRETPAPTPGVSPEPSPRPTVSPDGPPVSPPGWDPGSTPSPTPSPTATLAVSPRPTPTTAESPTQVRDPEAEPSPTPTAPRDMDLAALERVIKEARDPATPTEQRPNVLLALAHFDHARAYAFLGQVLAGTLDGLPSPNTSRAAAWSALGRLGTEAAARELLTAPRRSGPLGQRDSAHLLAALSQLRDDAGARLVATALVRRGVSEDDRYLLLQALGAIRRAVTCDAVLAFHAGRQPPWLRREAARVLGDLGQARALPQLLEGLRDRRRVMVRQGSALGVGLLAASAPETAPEGLAALIPVLGDDEHSVRASALEGLANCTHVIVVPALIGRLDPEVEPRRDLRERAREALACVTGRRFDDADAARRWLVGGLPLPLPGGGPHLMIGGGQGPLQSAASSAGGLVILLDASGSMRPQGKWTLGQFEVVRVLNSLPAQAKARVGFDVVVFADATKAVFRALVASSDRALVRKAVAAVEAEKARQVAQTDLARALQAALAYPDVDTVMLVSDGLLDAEQDLEDVLLRVTQENRRRVRPVRIHAVHLRGGGHAPRLDLQPDDPDHPEDVRFMKRLARSTGGLYLRN